MRQPNGYGNALNTPLLVKSAGPNSGGDMATMMSGA